MTTIRTTLGRLVAAEEAVSRLPTLLLPAQASYHASKLARLVTSELELYHTKRVEWVKELGATQADGRSMTVTTENWPEFDRRMTELLAVDVEIPWRSLQLSALGGALVTGDDILRLIDASLLNVDAEEKD